MSSETRLAAMLIGGFVALFLAYRGYQYHQCLARCDCVEPQERSANMLTNPAGWQAIQKYNLCISFKPMCRSSCQFP